MCIRDRYENEGNKADPAPERREKGCFFTLAHTLQHHVGTDRKRLEEESNALTSKGKDTDGDYLRVIPEHPDDAGGCLLYT